MIRRLSGGLLALICGAGAAIGEAVPALEPEPGPVWRRHTIDDTSKGADGVKLGDINGDGLLDVAVAVKPRDVVLCLQKPGGRWLEQVIRLDADRLGTAKAVNAADVNGDGLMDLFLTCEDARGAREGIVWLEQRPAGSWKLHALGGPEGVKFDLMKVLDLDGDGDLDVMTCEERDQLGVVWYENPHRSPGASPRE